MLHTRNLVLIVKSSRCPACRWRTGWASARWCPAAGRPHCTLASRRRPTCRPRWLGAEARGVAVSLFETSYFLSHEAVVPTPGGGMAAWRETLFAAMSRDTGGVVDFFRLPGKCGGGAGHARGDLNRVPATPVRVTVPSGAATGRHWFMAEADCADPGRFHQSVPLTHGFKPSLGSSGRTGPGHPWRARLRSLPSGRA